MSEWNSGQVSRYDPQTKAWKAWKLPGESPRAYAVYVDDRDQVWLSEWSANAMVRFDPETEKFEAFPSDRRGANVRQILGRPGEGISASGSLAAILTGSASWAGPISGECIRAAAGGLRLSPNTFLATAGATGCPITR